MGHAKKLPLVRGERITATVTEILDGGYLLLAIDGKLLRVRNESFKSYRVNQTVTLIVKSVEPLQFQWAGHLQQFNRLA